MADFYNDVNLLVNKIMDGRVDKKRAGIIIDDIKRKYGDDAFPAFEFEKKQKPWDRDYLQQLETKNVTGACSEEFILHMAEVSDYIAAKKKKTIVGIVIVVLIVVATIVIMLIGSNKDADSNEQSLSEEKILFL